MHILGVSDQTGRRPGWRFLNYLNRHGISTSDGMLFVTRDWVGILSLTLTSMSGLCCSSLEANSDTPDWKLRNCCLTRGNTCLSACFQR